MQVMNAISFGIPGNSAFCFPSRHVPIRASNVAFRTHRPLVIRHLAIAVAVPPARRPHARRRLKLVRLEDRALLSTFTVNSVGDTGTGLGLSGDLRYVITQVDKTPGDNTINFAVTGTITLNSALPDLSNTTGLTDIEGPGAASLTVARSSASGTPDFRIFTVDAGVTVRLSGMTIAGGSPGDRGGGIYNLGTATVIGSTFTRNSGSDGGGIYNLGTATVIGGTFTSNQAGDDGGGIFNEGGTATVIGSTFTNNTAGDSGGGIFNEGGMLTVRGSTFTSNSADPDSGGGGIFNELGGTLMVSGSTFTSNSAGAGGGIFNFGTVTVIGSTFTSNGAVGTGAGGGISNFNGGDATATVISSTFTSNSAGEDGGGISTFGMAAHLTVNSSTFTSNHAADSGGGISTRREADGEQQHLHRQPGRRIRLAAASTTSGRRR